MAQDKPAMDGAALVSALNARLAEISAALTTLNTGAGQSAALGVAGRRLALRQLDLAERALLLQGQTAARALPERLGALSDAEFRVTSQWGEDGVIEWLMRWVPTPNTRFVEFGVENFREANCRFLMQHRYWRGLVIDGSPQNIEMLKGQPIYWMHDLTAVAAFVTAENINDIIRSAGFEGEIGLLSVDIDGNDYWVWRAIDCVRPAIVVCEYNAIFGDLLPLSTPYRTDFTRFDHTSGLYYGASIAALIGLASQKGYVFVGSNAFGSNAFFVRSDLAAPVLERIQTVTAQPSLGRDSRNAEGQLTYARGLERLDLIKDQPVVNVETGEVQALRAFERLYSDDWLAKLA